jgi:FAD binding domain in molybdopterin dehydrogenase
VRIAVPLDSARRARPLQCAEAEAIHPFTLERPRDLSAALASRAQAGRNDAPAEYIAGGTDMVQLLQEDVRRLERLVSLARLLDDRIEEGPKGLRLGAAATKADVARTLPCSSSIPLSPRALELGQPSGAQSGHDRRQSPAPAPCVQSPDAECPCPPGSPAAQSWRPNEAARHMWRTLERAAREEWARLSPDFTGDFARLQRTHRASPWFR